MTLQDSFYALGIVYMTIMLLLTIALIAAIFTIKTKIDTIERHISERFQALSDAAEYGGQVIHKAQELFHRADSKKKK